MGGFLRRVFLLIALAAFGWAGYLYVFSGGGAPETALPDAQPAPNVAAAQAEAAPAPMAEAIRPATAGAPRDFSRAADQSGELAQSLSQADIAYNRPTNMSLGRPTNVQLVLDATGEAELREFLDGFIGDIIEARVGVGAEVSASLTGPGFEIERMSPERQMLSTEAASPNRWQWGVRPMEEGRRVLTLDIFAYVGDAAQPVRTYRDEIEVGVSNVGRVLSLAQTAHPIVGVIAGAVSMFIAIFGFARRRRR